MLSRSQTDEIKKTIGEFFEKMTLDVSDIKISASTAPSEKERIDSAAEERETISADVKISEPQILIGQQGQTLFEIQRLLRTILNKKLAEFFYFDLDINEYKNKKREYLKDLAKTMADQVSLTKEEKTLSPMPSYERRIIHAELSQRTDVATESQGEGLDRHIIIKPR